MTGADQRDDSSLTADGGEERELSFEAPGGASRRALVRLPRGEPPFRSAVVLPGLALPGPPPVKGYVSGIAAALTAAGTATMRCVPAWSQPGGTPLEQRDWQADLDDGIGILRLLQAQSWVDREQIYVVGLSLGGVAAPYIAAEVGGVAGIFAWASTGRPWAKYTLANLRFQLIWRGFPAETIARAAELSRYFHQALLDSDKEAAELLADNPGLAELEVTETGYLGRPTAFWRQLTRFDSVGYLRGLSCRLCVARGTSDYAAHDADLQAIVAAAQSAGLEVETATLPNLDHLLREASSAPEACRHGGGHGESQFARFAALVTAWMEKERGAYASGAM